ncbi:MAG: Crp/Fnr family transcriptional regulator [Rhodocyclaceae bacterium]|nr:Crp/Fnr family transcriptional regulator [Rhodocyclaceae bacterium]
MRPTQAGDRYAAEANGPDLYRMLERMPILAGLPETSIGMLASEARLTRFSRGQTIFRRGTAPTGLYFVIGGSVKLLAQDADGREKVIELFSSGQMFGEIGIFMHSSYRSWAQAVDRCTLVHVERHHVMKAIESDQELSGRMLREVSSRVQKLIDAICTTSSRLGITRVASYLSELSERSHPVTQVQLPAPKRTVASLLSLTHESFSRILRRLIDERVIEMSGRNVTILDRERLKSLVINSE